MRRQGGADPGIVGNDLVVLVDEIPVPNLFQQVPDRLNVLVVQGVVRLIKIYPEAHPFGHRLPIADVAHDRVAAAAGELRYPDCLLNFLFIEYSELFLNLVFDRQAVGIPASFARHMETLHGFVAGIDILETARQDVVDAGFAVCRRRTLIEGKKRSTRALLQAFLKHRLRPPELKDLLLEGWAVVACTDFAETHTDSRVLVPSPGFWFRSGAIRAAPGRGARARYHPALPDGCPALAQFSCAGPVSKVSRLSLLAGASVKCPGSVSGSGVIFIGTRPGDSSLPRSLGARACPITLPRQRHFACR